MIRTLGPYTLLRSLGRGGMGEVWLALGPGPEGDTPCVVKQVRRDMEQPVLIQRFLDESSVVMVLQHENIAQALEAGVVDDTAFLAFEWVRGCSVAELVNLLLSKAQTIPVDIAVHAASAVLAALTYAQAARDPRTRRPLDIVHRDVSPHNVMLDVHGVVKLIDFGVAQHELKVQQTAVGRLVGKVRYASPEYMRGSFYDGRSDLFAVGVTLYEMLSGARYYEKMSDDEVAQALADGDYRPAGLRSLPRRLRGVLDAALAWDPEQRLAEPALMRAALLDAHAFTEPPAQATARLVRRGFQHRLDQMQAEIEAAQGVLANQRRSADSSRTALTAIRLASMSGAKVPAAAFDRTGDDATAPVELSGFVPQDTGKTARAALPSSETELNPIPVLPPPPPGTDGVWLPVSPSTGETVPVPVLPPLAVPLSGSPTDRGPAHPPGGGTHATRWAALVAVMFVAVVVVGVIALVLWKAPPPAAPPAARAKVQQPEAPSGPAAWVAAPDAGVPAGPSELAEPEPSPPRTSGPRVRLPPRPVELAERVTYLTTLCHALRCSADIARRWNADAVLSPDDAARLGESAGVCLDRCGAP